MKLSPVTYNFVHVYNDPFTDTSFVSVIGILPVRIVPEYGNPHSKVSPSSHVKYGYGELRSNPVIIIKEPEKLQVPILIPPIVMA